jgi:hypothetical protein
MGVTILDRKRLKDLSTIILREAKSLLATSDRSNFVLTDPVLDSGTRRAQTFSDGHAGDDDYEVWIRLLRLHSSARNFVDQGGKAAADLEHEIIEFEKLLSPGSSPQEDSTQGSAPVVLQTD